MLQKSEVLIKVSWFFWFNKTFFYEHNFFEKIDQLIIIDNIEIYWQIFHFLQLVLHFSVLFKND